MLGKRLQCLFARAETRCRQRADYFENNGAHLMECSFLPELKRLEKNSLESVDDAFELSDYAKYLHVDRHIQSDLERIIEQEGQKPGKSLILVCGSAGDGKSHMLSYIKNQSSSENIGKFEIRNDATESDSPRHTAPQTLAAALRAFSDSRLNDGGQEKVIVAINLGLLSRFIETYKKEYSELKQFVDESKLLDAQLSDTRYVRESSFHAVSFSDYQPFTIKDGVLCVDYLNDLFSKVFSPVSDNRFYSKYQKTCISCTCNAFCPLSHNYQFLLDDEVRNQIIKLIVQVALTEQAVITTRSVLDFIYRIVVPVHFDAQSLIDKSNGNEGIFRQYYLKMTTPEIVFSLDSDESLLGCIREFDPCEINNGDIDDICVSFHTGIGISESIKRALSGAKYFDVIKGWNEGRKLDQGEVRPSPEEMFSFSMRCLYLMGELDSVVPTIANNDLDEFISILYSYNKGDFQGLKQLFKLLQKGVEDWDGDYPSPYSLVNTYGGIQALQEVEIKPINNSKASVDSEELAAFRQNVVLTVEAKSVPGNPVNFSIDYNLFQLLKKMRGGYQPTLMDKNRFSGFQSSYETFLATCNKGNGIRLANRTNEKTPRITIKRDEDFDEIVVEVSDDV